MRWIIAFAACALAQAAAADFQRWTRGATPPFALEDLKGRVHRLADYRGKVVLVNFWATWCEPCREEMPSIERLRASLSAEPFEVLAINLAEPRSRIEHFLANMPLSFPVLRDADAGTAKAWQARVLPASYLVDAAGRIRYLRFGEFDWSSEAARAKVRELLRSIPRSASDKAERSAAGENSARLAASARCRAR